MCCHLLYKHLLRDPQGSSCQCQRVFRWTPWGIQLMAEGLDQSSEFGRSGSSEVIATQTQAFSRYRYHMFFHVEFSVDPGVSCCRISRNRVLSMILCLFLLGEASWRRDESLDRLGPWVTLVDFKSLKEGVMKLRKVRSWELWSEDLVVGMPKRNQDLF